MPMEPFFVAHGIEASYGRLQVLWGVDLELREGESAVLLGSNGAGKTTLLKALLGLRPVLQGEILLAGQHMEHLRTDLRVQRGIHYMTELGVFPNLSVDENLQVGGLGLHHHDLRQRIGNLYETFPDLGRLHGAPAASLSGGQRKMLGVAKAIVVPPRLLLMDEPSAGLSPRYVSEVVATLRGLHEDGITMLIAEQNVKFLEIADRAYVLDGGRISFAGSVVELEANDAVRQAYFGVGGH
ncbi:MAG: ABC transporter ATP-binding protein [Thermaerobacter sp.]|nr:ABC transporter ATP-binding protein [Thermaerobacter sp.]